MSIYDKQKPATIKSMFNAIAQKYDYTNGILSFQLHRLWNNKLIASLPKAFAGCTLTDLCCGTGEIAFRWLNKNVCARQVYLVDFSSQMLTCAKNKEHKLSNKNQYKITYIEADVQALPLEDEVCNYATMAYGIRNVASVEQCFKEVYRILKNKGQFAMLELTRPKSKLLRVLHTLYLKFFLPCVGKWLTSNKAAYSYLGSSIGEFTDPAILAQKLSLAGFCNIRITPLTGGIATIIAAEKT